MEKIKQKLRLPAAKRKKEIKKEAPKRVIARRRQKPRQSPASNPIPTYRIDQSQPLYRVSQILIFVLLLRLYNFEWAIFTWGENGGRVPPVV